MKRIGPRARASSAASAWDEALDTDRRAVPRDRRLARRPASDPAVQLRRHDGQAAGLQPRPALLSSPRRVAARPHHLRHGGGGRLRRHARHAGRPRSGGGAFIAATSSTGARTPASPTCTCGRSCTRPARPAPRIVTIDPYRCKTAETQRLVAADPPRHRRRPGPGHDAHPLARRPAGRRLPGALLPRRRRSCASAP